MTNWSDLFTSRQLTLLTAIIDLLHEARRHILSDGADREYADAISLYLAFSISKIADNSSSLCVWMYMPSKEGTAHTFARAAIPMVWDYAEGNPFRPGPCDYGESCLWISRALDGLPHSNVREGGANQANAATSNYSELLVATDPPYYDNVPYSDLSDFFYVWLRLAIGEDFPELFKTLLTPKADELVADPMRQGGVDESERFFRDGYNRVFSRIRKDTSENFPISVFYGFKQSESNEDGHASTGWETLLEGMITSDWQVTATWPMRTERAGRVREIASNALASSIVLTCRPRQEDAGVTDRRGLIAALREEFPEALRRLEHGKVAPVDLRQAAIGPGIAVFSRYARVNEPDGSAMRVRTALSLINQVLDEKLSQLEGDVSADTRWCVEWFKGHGFEPGPFGEAETLSKGTDTGIAVLDRAGVLRARAGKVTLLSVREIPEEYDPERDERVSEWKVCLHLAKRLKEDGADETALLIAAARDMVDLDDVKELAYLLYSIAEKKGWAEAALLFNALGTSWTDLEDASRKITGLTQVQGLLGE